jgi:hypothetical protein
MAGVWREWGYVIVASALGLPVAALTTAGLSYMRSRSGQQTRWRYSIAEVGIVAGTLPWLWMILTPKPATRSVDLVPVHTIAAQLAGDPVTATVQLGGNLLVFAAFGCLAPLRWRIGWLAVVALAAAASAGVETLQYVLDLGRVSAIDDVLVNAAGAGLAAFSSRGWWRLRDAGTVSRR